MARPRLSLAFAANFPFDDAQTAPTIMRPAATPSRANARASLVAALALATLVGCGRTELFGSHAHVTGSAGSSGNPGTGGSGNPGTGGFGNPGTGGFGNPGTGGFGNPGTGGFGNPGTGGFGNPGTGGFGNPGTGGGFAGMSGMGGSGGMGGGPVTCAEMPEICNNGKDDNCNGLADCADPSCFGDPSCSKPGQEICNNGIDDDDDGLVDCADPDCATSLSCKPTPGREICDNGKDDNGDGLVDCADPQCTTFAGCLTVACAVDVDFGALASHGASVTRAIDTTGATRAFQTCATPGGDGRVASFTLAAAADVRLDLTQPMGAAHVAALFRAGASEACDRNPVTCVNAGDAPTTTQTFPALAAGTYFLIIQSFPNAAGATTVTLSTGASTTAEICDNGIDDDGNGLTDCADLACVNAPNCAASECKPDAALGALVVGAAAKSVRLDLTSAPSRYMPTCAGTGPNAMGGDAAIAFTLPEAGGVEIAFNQTGRTIFSLFRQPGPGLACDDDQLGCAFEDDRAGAVAFSDEPAGKYILIFKATQPGDEGVLNLRISAFRSRPTEVCGNGIDDDGNGLIDCADPACFGVGTCAAPACMPDVDLGSFSWGTMVTTTVDTTGGNDLYQTKCSKGNGGERVLRLTLTEPMALGVDCMDTGSHVLELAQQLGPLDACDTSGPQCADPTTLPFGCDYEIPDLQPGDYNLIIQAFQKGSEGKVTLSLAGVQEIVREICNNGIDDDGDGAIDCADRKCVTSPECAKFTCTAAKDFGLLALDGSDFSYLVQTTGAGDTDMDTMCVATEGGQDADIDFQLPATADVNLEWVQLGNHDFVLYTDDGSLLSCEAGTLSSCVRSAGQAIGMTSIPGLAAGKYHLVVDADAPGDEGSVAVHLSAVPAM